MSRNVPFFNTCNSAGTFTAALAGHETWTDAPTNIMNADAFMKNERSGWMFFFSSNSSPISSVPTCYSDWTVTNLYSRPLDTVIFVLLHQSVLPVEGSYWLIFLLQMTFKSCTFFRPEIDFQGLNVKRPGLIIVLWHFTDSRFTHRHIYLR